MEDKEGKLLKLLEKLLPEYRDSNNKTMVQYKEERVLGAYDKEPVVSNFIYRISRLKQQPFKGSNYYCYLLAFEKKQYEPLEIKLLTTSYAYSDNEEFVLLSTNRLNIEAFLNLLVVDGNETAEELFNKVVTLLKYFYSEQIDIALKEVNNVVQ